MGEERNLNSISLHVTVTRPTLRTFCSDFRYFYAMEHGCKCYQNITKNMIFSFLAVHCRVQRILVLLTGFTR